MKSMGNEVNFDGLVGPTHNYSGLSYGNIASINHRDAISNPRLAALQGLEKMKFLMDLGITQGVFPPHPRPHIPTLRAIGFQGTDSQIISKASKDVPEIFSACSSASSMWAANSATVSPSSDSEDGRVHFTPANLSSKFHRSIEYETTAAVLKAIFSDASCFVHHECLPKGNYFSDEGAANHTRFCKNFTSHGIQLFVFGRYGVQENTNNVTLYPARQTFEASQALARRHLLDAKATIFAQQNPMAVDAGVFHNDVISVGHENIFFYHKSAFINTDVVIREIQQKVEENCKTEMFFIPVSEEQISLKDSVASYLFNSQIVTLKDNTKSLIAPFECQEINSVKIFLEELSRNRHNQIKSIHYLDLRESMWNGGGPACLRLRVVLNDKELAQVNPKVILTKELYQTLRKWVIKNYREILHPKDLADPFLLQEEYKALEELTQILGLGNLYFFQH